MKNILIYTILIIGAFSNIQAQEQFHIHFDKAFYTSGEVMWYKIYHPQSLNANEFVIKVNMTDNNGMIKDSWFLESKGNGQSDGYFNIPYNWSNGNYGFHLSGFDNATKQVVNIGHVTVPIFNDLQDLEVTSSSDMMAKTTANSMRISLKSTSIKPGSDVSATIASGIGAGKNASNLSVSVMDADLCDSYGSNIKSISYSQNVTLANQCFISGSVSSPEGDPIPDMVLGAYSPIEDRINYLKTDADGTFVLRAPSFKGNRNIQFIAANGNPTFSVVLQEKVDGINLGEVKVTEAVKSYVELSRNRKKIAQFFGQSADPVTKESITFKPKNIKPENTYEVGDYQAFENVAEFFIEINSPLGFRLDKDTTLLARISKPVEYYTIRGQKDDAPLFIVDGKATRDAHFVGQVRLETIRSGELYYDPLTVNQKYKTLGSGGVVKLYSKDNDFFLSPEEENRILNVNGILPSGTPKVREELDGGNPWFAPQVYWNADLSTNAQGQAEISFSQTDDVSTFVIRVVGIKEDGSLSVGEQRFEVK